MQSEMKRKNHSLTHYFFAALFVLMSPATPLCLASESIQAADKDEKAATETSAEKADKENVPEETTPYPQIIESIPAAGTTDVDPKLTEIRVTFDRDMSEGMSWTGGGPEFPGDASSVAKWIDKRTCVLSVKLKKAAYYRVGINSKSHQNFKAEDGIATPPTAIFFTTKGAGRDLENRVRIPEVAEISPANEDQNVSPSTTELQVTFNMPMGEGMSWSGGGDLFPKLPEGAKPKWSKDGKTCTLPVSLEPNHEYKLGFNSLNHNNFRSKWGVPLKPVLYTFRTSAN